MLNNILGGIDATWIIIIALIFILLADSNDDGCGDNGGIFENIFDGNIIIIVLLLLLLFVDL